MLCPQVKRSKERQKAKKEKSMQSRNTQILTLLLKADTKTDLFQGIFELGLPVGLDHRVLQLRTLSFNLVPDVLGTARPPDAVDKHTDGAFRGHRCVCLCVCVTVCVTVGTVQLS